MRAVVGGQPVAQRGRDEQGCAGIGEHEGEAVGRVFGIERQVGGAGLEDAEQGDHHLEGALEAERHDGLGAGAERAQVVGELVGARVEFAVAQACVSQTSATASGVRAACAANSAGSVAAGTGRAVSFQSVRMVRRSAAERMSSAPMARPGSLTAAEQPDEAPAMASTWPLEQVGAVVEPQPQPLTRRRQEAQRIVRGVVSGDAGKMQAAGLGREAGSSTG